MTEQATESTTEVQTAVEVPVVEKKVETVDLAKHMAELKRIDRERQAERQRLKQEAEAEKQKYVSELKSAPIEKKIQELGLSADELSMHLLGLKETKPEDELKRELSELKAWKEAREAAESKAQNDKLIADYQKSVFSVLEQDGDKFELILQTPKGKDIYWNTLLQYYHKYGQEPDFKELAEGVENELFEQNKQLLGLKKFQPKPPEAKPKESVTPPAKESSQESFKTLNNRMTAKAQPKIKVVNPDAKLGMQSDFSRVMGDLNTRLKNRLK